MSITLESQHFDKNHNRYDSYIDSQVTLNHYKVRCEKYCLRSITVTKLIRLETNN